jgi:hypothetical protein
MKSTCGSMSLIPSMSLSKLHRSVHSSSAASAAHTHERRERSRPLANTQIRTTTTTASTVRLEHGRLPFVSACSSTHSASMELFLYLQEGQGERGVRGDR